MSEMNDSAPIKIGQVEIKKEYEGYLKYVNKAGEVFVMKQPKADPAELEARKKARAEDRAKQVVLNKKAQKKRSDMLNKAKRNVAEAKKKARKTENLTNESIRQKLADAIVEEERVRALNWRDLL